MLAHRGGKMKITKELNKFCPMLFSQTAWGNLVMINTLN